MSGVVVGYDVRLVREVKGSEARGPGLQMKYSVIYSQYTHPSLIIKNIENVKMFKCSTKSSMTFSSTAGLGLKFGGTRSLSRP